MLICHPDNLQWLKQKMVVDPQGKLIGHSGSLRGLCGVDVRTSEHMPKTTSVPTGRIISPDGIARDRDGWEWQLDRFTVYTESDLSWLMELGTVSEEMRDEPVFWHVGMSMCQQLSAAASLISF